ncbi:MAG: hypothetical protein RL095_2863 [Verrucomicrobiota bacterium]
MLFFKAADSQGPRSLIASGAKPSLIACRIGASYSSIRTTTLLPWWRWSASINRLRLFFSSSGVASFCRNRRVTACLSSSRARRQAACSLKSRPIRPAKVTCKSSMPPHFQSLSDRKITGKAPWLARISGASCKILRPAKSCAWSLAVMSNQHLSMFMLRVLPKRRGRGMSWHCEP